MITNKKTFSTRKAHWVSQCKKVCSQARGLEVSGKAGTYISMGQIYKLGHRIHTLVEGADYLAKSAVALEMREHVLKDIQNTAAELETYSDKLFMLLEKFSYITEHFPIYKTPMVYTTVYAEEPDPMSELEKIFEGG